MKKMICMLCCFLLLAAFPVSAGWEQITLPSKYATDAFCYSFETEDDFYHSDVAVARSADNTAKNKIYTPGAGGSRSALHIRQDCSVYKNGILNNGIDKITLYPGKTYKISAWVKLLSNDIFKAEPNFNFIFLSSGTTIYDDEACMVPSSATGVFEIVTAKGSDIGFCQSDGTISGEWRKLEVLYTIDQKFDKYYIRADSPFHCRMLLRVGSNAHTICTSSDYTDAFLSSITVPVTDAETGETTYEIDSSKYYTEYAVDDWSIEPYTEPAGIVQEPVLYNSFESARWNREPGATWSTVYSSTSLVVDKPEDSASNTNHVLQMQYGGSPYTYTDFTFTTDKTTAILHNRAYKISFWLKGSEAAATYFQGKSRYLKLIPERAYSDRLERTKHKWAETQLKDTLSTEWQKMEYIWYEPTPHMLGRTSENNATVRFDFRIYGLPKLGSEITENINGTDITYVYQYENDTGETVYAGFNDFRFWLDDFKVEPLGIVANGDFAYKSAADMPSINWNTTHYLPGENTTFPAIFGSGEIIEDATVPAGRNALVLKAGDAAPGQKTDIDHSSYYKISFWAKADTEESCGIGIAPVLDRSITGFVRDNAVTDINTEGRWGYGNLTGETGDIPYYLYSGELQTHTYDTLAVKTGETLVYDDYFARMKSCDGYEGQTAPTAWNYQYYNGTEWVSQNDLSVESDWNLTCQWQKFECFYRWDYTGAHYRMPRFSVLTTDDADFRLADIQVEKYNHPVDYMRIENLNYQNASNNFYVGNELRIGYDFVGMDENIQEGNSILKFLTGDENDVFAVTSMTYCKGSKQLLLEIPDLPLGSRLGLEIIPVSEDGSTGAVHRTYFGGIIAGKLEPELTANDTRVTFTVKSSFAENFRNNGVTALLSLYDARNRLQKISAFPINTASPDTLSGSTPINGAAKAKLLIVDSLGNLVPCCDSKTELIFGKNSLPFANTDTITVAYMGGSPMAGKGIFYPEESTYRAYITEYFADTYPDKQIRALNYSKEDKGTEYGLSIAAEVAANNPDVIFIDYALDDNRTDVRKELTAMIETLCAGDKIPYIVFLYATDNDYTDFSKFYKEVAEYYSIPQIDLRTGLKTHLMGLDAKREGYLLDSVHPSGEGHIIYGRTIIQALETEKYFHRPK